MEQRSDAASSFSCVNCGAKVPAPDGSCPGCGAPPWVGGRKKADSSFLEEPGFWVLGRVIDAIRDGRGWMTQQRRIRRGVVVTARFAPGWKEIEVAIANRRPAVVTVVGVGLQRRQDPGATYRCDISPSERIPPDGTFTATVDVDTAVTAAPIHERVFNRDLNEVFAELQDQERRIVWPLPPHVREELRIRRQRYRHFGRP
jgi:hypothetical protein